MEDIEKTGYGYIRVSTEEQVDGASLLNQRQEINKYADQHNIKIIGWYEDDGVSAKTANRDALKTMLTDAQNNKGGVDFVIVYNLSRISRNLESFAKDIGYRLASYGVNLRSTKEPIDETPAGKLMKNIAIAVHQFDNDTKSQTTSDNMKVVASQGWWQSKPPLGLVIEKVPIGKGRDNKVKYRNVLKPDKRDELGDKVAKALTIYSLGNVTFMETLQYAHKLDIRGRNGELLTDSTLEHLLQNSAYCGWISSKKLTNDELVKANWDGIISRDIYERNQAIMSGDKRTFRPQPDETYPLKNILTCMHCGKRMRASAPRNGSGKPSPRYHCSNCKSGSLSPTDTHTLFNNYLKEIAPTENTVKLFSTILKRTAGQRLKSTNAEMKSLREKQGVINEDIEKSLQRLIDGDITREEKDIYITRKNQQRQALEADINELEQNQRVSEATIEYVCNFIRMPAKLWRDSDYETKQVLQNLLFPDGVTFDIKERKFGTEDLSIFYRLKANKKEPSELEDSHLVIPRRIELLLPG